MKLGSKLKEMRKRLNLTANEVSEKLKEMGYEVTGKTLSGYENSIRMPNADVFMALCQIYGCKNILEAFSFVKPDYSIPTDDEWEMIEKYRALDGLGQNAVDWQLKHESARVAALKELQSKQAPRRIFAYYGKIAAAGTWVEFSDMIAGTKEYYLTDENINADYTIGVNGDSMEPTYFDGDIVFVKSTTNLNVGDVGIFQKDNSIYIKEVGETGLISHNPKYPPMVNGGDVHCLGKVIGKATEDMVV